MSDQQNQGRGDQNRDRQDAGNRPLNSAVEGSGNVLLTVIDTSAEVLEELAHAAGRVGTAVVGEVFNILGSLVGGVSDTTTTLFQGRRIGRRGEGADQQHRQAL